MAQVCEIFFKPRIVWLKLAGHLQHGFVVFESCASNAIPDHVHQKK
jgi:hypothetical protein